ncbi:hypothetical protein FRB95_004373 [Tulasnella sp. JGI-2019a]|nr:hypothetical protein FRB95_004373 [Tulasnella sp. JGI-2019a]
MIRRASPLYSKVKLLAILAVTCLEVVQAQVGTALIGAPCNITRNRLAGTSHEFLSACIPQAYCDPTTSTCLQRGCRTQAFPTKNDSALPPFCGSGTFCPDEGDQCLPLQPTGGNCQMDRDDQCTPNGSTSAICLKFTCFLANVTLGNTCVVDNNPYIGYRTNGSQFANIVSRDNCQQGLYCDSQTLGCKQQLDFGADCSADKMCLSHNCGTDDKCHLRAGTVQRIPFWQYIITGVGIVVFILGILIGLFLIHRKDRAQKQREIREYFHEQTTYRSSIIALHTAARDRTSSLYGDSSSRLSQYDEHGNMIYRDDDSQRGLMDSNRRMSTDHSRRSHLRNSMIAEDDEDEDENRAQNRGLLAPYGESRENFDQETPRQSYDYGQPSGSGSGYNAVPMRQSVDLPIGAGTPGRPGQGPYNDPFSG